MNKFKLKSSTTNVSADRSILLIEKLLTNFGADKIYKQYLTDGKCTSIQFMLDKKGYKLPANIDGVFNVLFKRGSHTQSRDLKAYNVSWRIIANWVHSQLSIIASGQAQPDEVLLPYMYNGKQTFFEAYKSGNLMLSSGDENND